MTETQEKKNYKASDFYKVGDLLYTSWGYDQTNVEFYKVKRVLARSIELVAIATNITENGFMSGYAVPDPAAELDEKSYAAEQNGIKRVQENGVVRIMKYSLGRRYEDGDKVYCSWYA
jgi:hypothetical protein